MNLDELQQRTLIDLDDEEQQSIAAELDDVLNKLRTLKDVQPTQTTPQQSPELRDDKTSDQTYTTTSDNKDNDHIISPEP